MALQHLNIKPHHAGGRHDLQTGGWLRRLEQDDQRSAKPGETAALASNGGRGRPCRGSRISTMSAAEKVAYHARKWSGIPARFCGFRKAGKPDLRALHPPIFSPNCEAVASGMPMLAVEPC